MDNNIFQITNDATNKTVEKIKQGVQKYLIFIVLLFNIAMTIVSRLYRLGLQNPFSQEFFVDFLISTSTSMLCYVCFIPFGRQDEMNRNKTFNDNVVLWHSLTEKVRNGFLEIFQMFCNEQLEIERSEKKRLILANNTIMEFSTFLQQYNGKSKKEIKQLYKADKLTKEQYRAILKCNKVKVKPINPLVVLQEAEETHYNDAGRDTTNYAKNKALQRPLMIFIMSLAFNTITTTFMNIGENVIMEMLISIFSIVFASVCGYSTGTNDFKQKENRIKAKVMFLSLFCEKNKI